MIESNLFGKKLQSETSQLLLTNGCGGFFLYSPTYFSKYQGLSFLHGQELYKTLDSIHQEEAAVAGIRYRGFDFEVVQKNEALEQYFVPFNMNALVYETNSQKPLIFTFDCRAQYDMRTWGRTYEVFVEDGVLIVKYTKRFDAQEAQQNGREYELYTAIITDTLDYSLVGKWREVRYEFDAARFDGASRFVYDAFMLNTHRAVIASAVAKEDAVRCAHTVFSTLKQLRIESAQRFPQQASKKFRTHDLSVAYGLSEHALTSLIVATSSFEGVYAGLPWFSQFWTRDSALCARAYILMNDYDFVKRLLLSYISLIRPDGLIPNRIPAGGLDSLDGVGLVFFRLAELFEMIEQGKLSATFFSEKETRTILNALERVLLSLERYHTADGFIVGNMYETWMDTGARTGARIEIQALQLSLYRLFGILAQQVHDTKRMKVAKTKERDFAKFVRNAFYENGILYDGKDDSTIRPNVFLAYYFYPSLLSAAEWESVFDRTLAAVWLAWGGLATIDVHDGRFLARHTGMSNTSYHSGDSWYFLNNLAAIALHRLNDRKYQSYVGSILQASTFEILQRGIFGYHAELSSAQNLESNGCLAQTWSSAFYIELLHELFE